MNIDIIDIDTVDATTVRIDGVEFAKSDCAVSAYGSQHAQIVASGQTFIASHGSAVNGYRPRGQAALVHAINGTLRPAATPEDFGARPGDATFDSGPAIRQAIAALNYLNIKGDYYVDGDIVISTSNFRAFGKGSLTINNGGVVFDPSLLASGNFIYTPVWADIHVTRTGTVGPAFHVKGTYPTTKGVAQMKLRDFEVRSTGAGLVMQSPIIASVDNVSTGACGAETFHFKEANCLHLSDCRPFNGGSVVFDGCVSWSIKGGTVEKINDATGALKLAGTNRPCEAFDIAGVWFEDNTGNDIIVGYGASQATTGSIKQCRFRMDTAHAHGIEWIAAREVTAQGNRYTGYTYPHGWDTASTSVIRCTAQGENYGSAVVAWINNATGRVSRQDVESFITTVDFGTVAANSLVSVTLPGSPFGTGTGLPSNANDCIQVSPVAKQFGPIIVDGLITGAGAITVTAYNLSAAPVVLGSKKVRVDLYRN